MNVATMLGVVSGAPVERALDSGASIWQVDLITDVDGCKVGAPVRVHIDEDEQAGELAVLMRALVAGDEVAVAGHVARRFFRAGALTQSRTEVVASQVVRIAERAALRRLLERVARTVEPTKASALRSAPALAARDRAGKTLEGEPRGHSVPARQ